MKVTLQVKENVVGTYVYHKLNIPAALSKMLGIKGADNLIIDILEINGVPTSQLEGLENN